MKTLLIIITLVSAIAAMLFLSQDSVLAHDIYKAGQQAGWQRMNADRTAKGLSIKEYQATAYYKTVLKPAWDATGGNAGKF